ncbi:unnamed protein product [Tuber aestivum]|uniref:Zn(2)-C6 fungal-type domain-containing protein n=1 Tax=Tuber aestivum TaxID=59557 RepID=A0A292PZS0_9PEZI|nr:unnamed protein product [Tuber aestivum]
MPKLFLPPRKISEPSNTSVASSTPVHSRAGPSLNVSSSPSPTDVPVANPNTHIPPLPTLNTGTAAPTPVLSLSPLFIDGNSHGKAITPPTLSRPSSSNRRKGPPRIVACVSCHKQKKKCGGERPCTRCLVLGAVCVEQERPSDGFQYIRKKKKLRSERALDPLPQLPVHPVNHPAPFPGSLWAAMAQQASYDSPVYQNQLPSPSPSLTMVGTPSDSPSERDLSYQGSGPGGNGERRDRSPRVASGDVTQCCGDESTPTQTPVSIVAPPSPSPEPDSVANQLTSHTISDYFDTALELVPGPSDPDLSPLTDLEADLELDLELFGSPENEGSSPDGCNAVDTPILSEQAESTAQLGKGGGETTPSAGFSELEWEAWNTKYPSADVAPSSPSFLDLDGGFDFLEPPPPGSPAPMTPVRKHTPQLQLEGTTIANTT